MSPWSPAWRRRNSDMEVASKCLAGPSCYTLQHLIQSCLGLHRPALPAWNLHHLTTDIRLFGHQRIAAGLGPQRPVRPSAIVALAKLRQADSRMLRIVVQPPVNFLGLKRLMESLQQA